MESKPYVPIQLANLLQITRTLTQGFCLLSSPWVELQGLGCFWGMVSAQLCILTSGAWGSPEGISHLPRDMLLHVRPGPGTVYVCGVQGLSDKATRQVARRTPLLDVGNNRRGSFSQSSQTPVTAP